MIEFLDSIAAFQAKGGLLIFIVWGVFEIRSIRRDFNRHRHGKDGRPFINVVESE